MAANLPADAVFVQDGYVGLGEPFDRRTGRPDRPDVRVFGEALYGSGRGAPDAGDLATLRALGVGYAAVADTNYDWYLNPHARPPPGGGRALADRQRWYRELFATAELVWRDAPEHPTYSQYNNPEIRLYRLRPAADGGSHASPR